MSSIDRIGATISRGGGSIETMTGRSSGLGSSSAVNWLDNRLGGMKCPAPHGHAAGDQLFASFEIDEAHVPAFADQNIAVAALERGAPDDAACRRGARLVDPGGNRAQPRPAVLIGQRNALPHLVDVRRRMKRIGVAELPLERSGEERSDSRFAASGNAHHDKDGGPQRHPLHLQSQRACRTPSTPCWLRSAGHLRFEVTAKPMPHGRRELIGTHSWPRRMRRLMMLPPMRPRPTIPRRCMALSS